MSRLPRQPPVPRRFIEPSCDRLEEFSQNIQEKEGTDKVKGKDKLTSLNDVFYFLKIFKLLSDNEICQDDLKRYQKLRPHLSFLDGLNQTILRCYQTLKNNERWLQNLNSFKMEEYLEGLRRIDVEKDYPLNQLLTILNQGCPELDISFYFDSPNRAGVVIQPEDDSFLLVQQDRWDPVEDRDSNFLSEKGRREVAIQTKGQKEVTINQLDSLLKEIYSLEDLEKAFKKKWGFPKGGVLKFYQSSKRLPSGVYTLEHYPSAASREIKEETGLNVSPQLISLLPYKNLRDNRYYILDLEKEKGKEVEELKREIKRGFKIEKDTKEEKELKDKLKRRILFFFSGKDKEDKERYLENIDQLKGMYREIEKVEVVKKENLRPEMLNSDAKKIIFGEGRGKGIDRRYPF